MEAHVHVVNQQIEDGAAADRRVQQPRAPGGRRAPPPECGRAHGAEAARFHAVHHRAVHGEEAYHLGDHQDAAAASGGVEHGIRRSGIERHGLFDQHVLAGVEGGNGRRSVQVRRQADVDGLGPRVVDGLAPVAVGGDVREVLPLARPADVALNAGEIARELARVVARDGHQLRPRDAGQRLEVGRSHEAQADDRNLHM